MYKTILHATDLSENHFDLCKKAAEIASSFKAELHLLHVIEPPSTLQLAQSLGFAEIAAPAKEGAQTVLQVLGETLCIPPAHQHLLIGPVKKQILDKIISLSVDLIIVGRHTPNIVPQFLGSTANAVVNQAHCDVLTLRV